MKRFVIADSTTGNIVRIYIGPEDLAGIQARSGECIFESADATCMTHYVRGGALQQYTAAEQAGLQERPTWAAEWSNGDMAWVDPRTPQQRLDETWAAVRADRDQRMNAVAWRCERHARQARIGLPLSDDIAALDAYMQALADITQQPDPFNINWPVPPAE